MEHENCSNDYIDVSTVATEDTELGTGSTGVTSTPANGSSAGGNSGGSSSSFRKDTSVVCNSDSLEPGENDPLVVAAAASSSAAQRETPETAADGSSSSSSSKGHRRQRSLSPIKRIGQKIMMRKMSNACDSDDEKGDSEDDEDVLLRAVVTKHPDGSVGETRVMLENRAYSGDGEENEEEEERKELERERNSISMA